MVISTNLLGHLRSYFLKKKEYIVAEGIQLIPSVKPVYHNNCRRSNNALMSLKGILNVDIFYLPKCTDLLYRF